MRVAVARARGSGRPCAAAPRRGACPRRRGRARGSAAARRRSSRTVIRGFSDAYGSWKTIWMSRRMRTHLPPLEVRDVLAVEDDLPAVGSSSWMSGRPGVDLPQPDSPTSPSVSPRTTVKSTPATACTWPTVRLNSPALIGKSLTRSSTRSSSSTVRRAHSRRRRRACVIAHGPSPTPDPTPTAFRPRAPRRSGMRSDGRSLACDASSAGCSVRQRLGPATRSSAGGTRTRRRRDQLGGWPGIGCEPFLVGVESRGRRRQQSDVYGCRGA